MKHEITPNVIHDLWPLCQSGDASAESRALVDAYLAHDPRFATQLKESKTMNNAIPNVTLSPDTERRLLEEARTSARIKLMLVGAGVVAVLFAFSMLLILLMRDGRPF